MKVKENIEIEDKNQTQQAIESGIWHPSLFEWRDVIEDYLLISRKRTNNRLSMFKLQLDLMGEIYKIQDTIKAYKQIIRDPSNIEKYNETATAKDVSEDNLKYFENEIRRDKLIIKSIKEIADGHLWRMFDFNNALMYCLGIEEDSGYLQLDEGGLIELNKWGNKINNESIIVHFILNSLTNYARIGDVIVKNNAGIIEVIEIKSSKSCSGKKWRERLIRQKNRRENFESFANNNIGKLRGEVIHIENSPITQKNHFNILQKVLSECELKGVSSYILDNYLAILIEDYSKPKKTEKEYRKLIDNLFKSIKKGNDIIFPADSQIRKKYSPNFTPLSIFPIDEKFIADLMLGKKRIYYYVNFSEILRVFEKKGWAILSTFLDEKVTKEKDEIPFCIMRYKELTISVPWLIINQIIFDFLSIDSVCELFMYTYEQKDIKKERILYNFKNIDLWI